MNHCLICPSGTPATHELRLSIPLHTPIRLCSSCADRWSAQGFTTVERGSDGVGEVPPDETMSGPLSTAALTQTSGLSAESAG